MDDFEKFYNSSLRFLSYRPRSEKEVREKLLSKKASAEIIQKVIDKLKEHRFLDDLEFSLWFFEQRTKVRPKALRIIKIELRRKGISEEIMEKVMNDKGLMINDLDSAKKLLERKFDKYKSMERNEIYKKLGSFLARRGFDWDTTKKAIDEIFDKGV